MTAMTTDFEETRRAEAQRQIDSNLAELERRENVKQDRLRQVAAVVQQGQERTDEEVAELHTRLARVMGEEAQPPAHEPWGDNAHPADQA